MSPLVPVPLVVLLELHATAARVRERAAARRELFFILDSIRGVDDASDETGSRERERGEPVQGEAGAGSMGHVRSPMSGT